MMELNIEAINDKKIDKIQELCNEFDDMTEEQKLKFQGFFLAMNLLRDSKKSQEKEIA